MSRLEWYDKIAECIIDNLPEFYETFYSEKLTKVGADYRLEPCPQCGHNGCCTVGVAVHCFSCGWSGTHINAFIDYFAKKGKGQDEAIKELEKFFNLPYPKLSKEESEEVAQRDKLFMIRSMAINFYHKQLISLQKTFSFTKGEISRSLTPLQYQTDVRGHKIESLQMFQVGFVDDYLGLWNYLIKCGFTKEEIKEAKVWFPEGTFVYPYFHPVTRDVLRINIKNPFRITITNKNGDEEVVAGMSSGNKVMGFVPGFSFSKPMMVVEGENDALTIYEQGFRNICWGGGTLTDDQLKILNRASAPVYLCFDHDSAGEKYIKTVDDFLPHKDVRVIEFNNNYNDIDEYYQNCSNPVSIENLVAEAKSLPVDDHQFKIYREDGKWIIANRFKRIEYRISGKDAKGAIIGQADFYVDGQLADREDDKSLSRCRAKMRPFNFYLSDSIEQYFNTGLEERSFDELLDIYWYSSHKSQIIKLFAKNLYSSNNNEDLVQAIKLRLGEDVSDAILKEVNDLQNIDALKTYSNIPKIKVSHYFNVRNNDAYFYYTCVKQDGDAVRKLPFLLRNDKQSIRLDLLKRKDSQCLLLIDNKYELPFEITEAVMELSECSLTQEWVEKYQEGSMTAEQLSPNTIVRAIESYLRKFYYHVNPNIYKVLALYVYGTYYYELFGQYPYLFLHGEKGSGKSILDIALYLFSLNAKLAVNISEASLFRMISIEGGTFIMDEMENLTSRSKSADSIMASLFKGGYTNALKVYRYNTEKNASEGFDIYGPKIISNIFGLDDVIEDRCIRIDTYRLSVGEVPKLEDPKRYLAERLDEVRAVTSAACLSALENFQLLDRIYSEEQFVTKNARLSQILTPIYAIARLVDLSAQHTTLTSDMNIENTEGEYVSAFVNFYETVISSTKQEIEDSTPEGIAKSIVRRVALELVDAVPSNDKSYSIPQFHKYTEPIEFNVEEGWFELNTVHMKCFIEEHMPGETAYPRTISKWMKTSFQFEPKDVVRKVVSIEESEELLKEFRGNKRPKVNCYRFYFRDFLGDSFIGSASEIKTESSGGKLSKEEFQDLFF